MPMKYNEDTGQPYFVPDTAIELEEGVTPKPDVLRYGKRGMFAGDPPPKFDNGLNDDPMAVERLIKGALDPKPKANPAPPSDAEFFVKLGKSLGVEKPIDSTTHIKGEQTTVPVGGVEQGKPDLGKLYDDAMYSDGIAKMATPATLSATIATDAEIAEIERLCNERSVMYWPTLMRLINRVRMTEELLRVERSRR